MGKLLQFVDRNKSFLIKFNTCQFLFCIMNAYLILVQQSCIYRLYIAFLRKPLYGGYFSIRDIFLRIPLFKVFAIHSSNQSGRKGDSKKGEDSVGKGDAVSLGIFSSQF